MIYLTLRKILPTQSVRKIKQLSPSKKEGVHAFAHCLLLARRLKSTFIYFVVQISLPTVLRIDTRNKTIFRLQSNHS